MYFTRQLAAALVQLFLLVSILGHIQCMNPAVNGANRNLTNCYVSEEDQDQHWVLQWEEQFGGDLSQWQVQQEGKFCSGNNVEAESCNVKENAFTLHNNLVLLAKHSTHYTRSFTGAQITSPFMFPQYYPADNVRIEIRAAFPLGTQLYGSLFAVNKKDDKYQWGKYTWFELATNMQHPYISFGAHYEKPGAYKDSIKEYETLDLNRYQTYGIEWNGTYVNLNVNGNISKETEIRKPSDPTDFQLVFVVGVGGKHFHQPLPLDFAHLKWICPALIIDYVRVFEQVASAPNYPKCKFNDSPDEVLDGICKMALEHSSNSDEDEHTVVGSDVGLGLIIFIAILLGLSLLAFAYFFIRSGKLRSTRVGTYQRNNEDFLFEYNRQNGESAVNGAFDGRN